MALTVQLDQRVLTAQLDRKEYREQTEQMVLTVLMAQSDLRDQ